MRIARITTFQQIRIAALIVSALVIGCGTGVRDVSKPAIFRVGGHLVGLEAGKNIVLQNNGGDNLALNADGDFIFKNSINAGLSYNVTVYTQPSEQTCTVSNGRGVANGDATSVLVACEKGFGVGGYVSGLADGASLVLQNNGGDDLSLSYNEKFNFKKGFANGSNYRVTVSKQPVDQECSVVNGSGTVKNAEVTTIDITCSAQLILTASPLSRTISLSWNDIGARQYDLYRSTDANCNFDQITSCAGGSLSVGVTSPYNVNLLEDGVVYFFGLRANLINSGHYRISNTASGRPDKVITNGTLYAIANAANGMVYLGGDFTRIGARTGGGIPLDKGFGSPINGNYAQVTGTVYAAVADGGGGFYIGGAFTAVGGLARDNLAHIFADGTLDLNWGPKTNGTVRALAISGKTVFAGGVFSKIDGLPIQRLAAIDAVSGIVRGDWNPNPDSLVYALAILGNTIYVGGKFLKIGSSATVSPKYLAALDMSTGMVDSNWSPSPDNFVLALAASGGKVYVGGLFASIGISTAVVPKYLAAVDAVTGMVDTTWNPSPSNVVYALTISGTTLYAAGGFQTIGTPLIRKIKYLAALDLGTAEVNKDWHPNPDGWVHAVTVSDNKVYAGGSFTHIGTPTSKIRNHAAMLDASSGAVNKAWNPSPNGRVDALAASGNAVYTGGEFSGTDSLSFSNLLALNATTGVVELDWSPNPNYAVLALAVSGNTVYAGGDFTSIGPSALSSPKYLAALAAATGVVNINWNPNPNGAIKALLVSGNVVYAGGDFTAIGSATNPTSKYLAAIDTGGTGAVNDKWNPSPNGAVKALAMSGNTLYAGGNFIGAGTSASVSPKYLAAFDAGGTGSVNANWNPNPDNAVSVLVASGNTIFAGGDFTSIGTSSNAPPKYLAALDAAGTGIVNSAWNPSPNGPVRSLAVLGTSIYAGGEFTAVGTPASVTRNYVAAINISDGAVNPAWNPGADGFVYSLVGSGGLIYAGGKFTSFNKLLTGSFAVIPP